MNINVLNLLVESNYSLEIINCHIKHHNVELNINFTYITDIENFIDLIQQRLNYNLNDKVINLLLKLDLDLTDLSKIIFPKTKEIEIENFSFIENPLNLSLLSSNLNKLTIISSIQFDINNLPNDLEQLSLLDCKFNLDCLPENLKKLAIISDDYLIDDFANLPKDLTQIYICKKK